MLGQLVVPALIPVACYFVRAVWNHAVFSIVVAMLAVAVTASFGIAECGVLGTEILAMSAPNASATVNMSRLQDSVLPCVLKSSAAAVTRTLAFAFRCVAFVRGLVDYTKTVM